jgi:hypothetical protein
VDEKNETEKTELVKGKETFFKTMPSGDVYGLRKLTYRERKAIMSESSKISWKEEYDEETKRTIQKPEPSVDVFKMQMKILSKTIMSAPWLKENEVITEEKLDFIKNEDANELDAFQDSLNFPKKDELE